MRLRVLTCIVIIFYPYQLCSATCHTITASSGLIKDSQRDTYETYSACYVIPVPEDTYVTIEIVSLSFKGDCSRVYLDIREAITNKLNNYCVSNSGQRIFRALNSLTISYYHEGRDDWYRQSTFELRYSKESIMCTRKDHFRCSDHQCIHINQVCDRTDDCENGSDEDNCDREIVSVKGAKDIRSTAMAWLMERSVSHGWGRDTPRAITALCLAEDDSESQRSKSEKQLEEELRSKQLELRTSVALLRNSSEPISISELSMFVNALIVTCHNPRQFYGYDLVRILYERVSIQNTIIPGAYLTLCNSDWILSESDAKDLFELLRKNSDFFFLTDIQAMTILVLSCIQNKYEEYGYLFNDSSIFNETLETFIESQLPDGSFGNVYTTALVTQALISTGQETNTKWNVTSTVNYLKHQLNQKSMNFLSVYLTLPVLNSKSLVDIGKANCENSYKRQEVTDISDVTERLDEKMIIQYSLFIGDERDIIHTMYLKMPKNCSAFDIMRVAQTTDPKYEFQHRSSSGGIYVYQIAHITNDPEAGKFWMLYTKHEESGAIKMHKESLDKCMVNDGGHLIMWYKTVHL